MKRSIILFVFLLLAARAVPFVAAAADLVHTVDKVPAEAPNRHYASNRPPLATSPLVKLPIGAIEPRGWLREVLLTQTKGMNGRLPEISAACKAEGNAWMSPNGKGAHTWEDLPYWLRGFGDLGYVLGDERIKAETRKWIEGILSSRQEDGWFGPVANKAGRRFPGKIDFWPNMLALNCLQSYYEHTGDERVLEHMTAYFRFQQAVPEGEFIVPYWQFMRSGDNLASVYWLYNRTGEKWLLDLAAKIHRRTANWTSGIPMWSGVSWHGVNICQGFREPAIYWMQAREKKFRDAAYRNYETVIGLYGQVPGGMFAADEHCRPGRGDPRQGAETCSMVEFMHSFEMLTRITGDPVWADRCEEVAFNDLPPSQPADQKGLHYLTAPNQPVLDANDHFPGVANQGCLFAYDPHGYRCCQLNHGHGWPYMAEELWLATADNGLCASLYCASEVNARVGAEGKTVTVAEETAYPFDEVVTLKIRTAGKVRFPLYLRIPGWCEEASAAVNGGEVEVAPKPRSYLVIERDWADGDTVTLRLPMSLEATVWHKNRNAVSIRRGPLWFSLKIGEEWKRYGGTDEWPAYEVFPTTPWNYGLEIDPGRPEESVRVVAGQPAARSELTPFRPEYPTVTLKARARRIPGWKLDEHGLAAVLPASPVRSEEPIEEVTLIPMGCARLRISAFPVVGERSGPEELSAGIRGNGR